MPVSAAAGRASARVMSKAHEDEPSVPSASMAIGCAHPGRPWPSGGGSPSMMGGSGGGGRSRRAAATCVIFFASWCEFLRKLQSFTYFPARINSVSFCC